MFDRSLARFESRDQIQILKLMDKKKCKSISQLIYGDDEGSESEEKFAECKFSKVLRSR